MAKVDLYPTKNASPAQAEVQTGTSLSGSKVAADTVVLNTVDGDVIIKGLETAATSSRITLVNTQWRALPTTTLTDRRVVIVQNQSGNGATILLNYSNTAAANLGFRVLDGGHREILIGDGLTLYGRIQAPTATGTAYVEELA
jgi:type 1 fimbria pilin